MLSRASCLKVVQPGAVLDAIKSLTELPRIPQVADRTDFHHVVVSRTSMATHLVCEIRRLISGEETRERFHPSRIREAVNSLDELVISSVALGDAELTRALRDSTQVAKQILEGVNALATSSSQPATTTCEVCRRGGNNRGSCYI